MRSVQHRVGCDAEAPDLVRTLATGLRDRRLYKRAAEIGIDDPDFARLERLWFRPAQRAVLEDGWAAAAGASQGGVLLDVPEPRRIVVDLVSGLATTDLDRFQRWVRKIRVFAADHDVAAAFAAARLV
jgi:hypothetical protein